MPPRLVHLVHQRAAENGQLDLPIGVGASGSTSLGTRRRSVHAERRLHPGRLPGRPGPLLQRVQQPAASHLFLVSCGRGRCGRIGDGVPRLLGASAGGPGALLQSTQSAIHL